MSARFVLNILGISFVALSTASAENAPPKQHTAVLRTGTIVLDGKLSEDDWQQLEASSDFVQRSPVPGAAVDYQTSFRVLYDDKALYVGIRCDQPTAPRVKTLRRDNFFIFSDDSVSVKIDPNLDRRTTLYFTTNAAGAQYDRLVLDNGQQSILAFDALWEVASHTDDTGWSVEYRIPFTALGLSGGRLDRTLGLDIRREVHSRKQSYEWAEHPRGVSSDNAQFYGELRGIRDIEGGQPLLFQPYLVSGTDSEEGNTRNQGFDLKANLSGLGSAQLSVRTDFAQISPDDAFVNLGRFAVALPERRPFFLEGTEIFSFGGEANQLFFSRRIGIEDDISGASVLAPIDFGLKTQGRKGKYSFGFLDVQTGAAEGLLEGSTTAPSNVAVARLRRELGSIGNTGFLLTYKQSSLGEEDPGATGLSLGWDGSASLLDGRLQASTSVGLTQNQDVVRDANGEALPDLVTDAFTTTKEQGLGFDGSLNYGGDVYSGGLFGSLLTPDYNPAVGFAPRTDLASLGGFLEWSPQPKSSKLSSHPIDLFSFARFNSDFSQRLDLIQSVSGSLSWKNGYSIGTENSVSLSFQDEDFSPLPGLLIPTGDYLENSVSFFVDTPSTNNAGAFLAAFYNKSHRRDDALSTEDVVQTNTGFRLKSRANVGQKLLVSMSMRDSVLSVQHEAEPEASSANILTLNASLNYTFSTFLAFDTLYQVTDITSLSDEAETRAEKRFFGNQLLQSRLSWRYQPGSDIFLVYRASNTLAAFGEAASAWEQSLVLKVSLALEIAK